MNLTNYFLSASKDCEEFSEAMDIVRSNSSGGIWLIGGFVYRNIASVLYGVDVPSVDLDFIVENPIDNFKLPSGWDVQLNRFGNPKFVKGAQEIDFVQLNTVYSIVKRGVKPSIDNYLTGVPLNVQSIAYDPNESKIIGDLGIEAILKRRVKINDPFFAKYAARKANMSVNKMVIEKARSLRFRAILPKANSTK